MLLANQNFIRISPKTVGERTGKKPEKCENYKSEICEKGRTLDPSPTKESSLASLLAGKKILILRVSQLSPLCQTCKRKLEKSLDLK